MIQDLKLEVKQIFTRVFEAVRKIKINPKKERKMQL